MGDSYYRWFPGDYLRDTGDLSMVEDCAYRRLLDHYYSEGRLPSDNSRLYRICRATALEEQRAVDFIVGRFFTVEGDRLCNVRAEKELGERRKFIEEQTRKSTLGHIARWGKEMPGGKPVGIVRAPIGPCPEVCPDDALPSPSPSPLRIEPTPLSEPAVSDGSDIDAKEPSRSRKRISYPDAFTEFWSAYPRPVGKTAAYEAWVKITKDGYPPEDILRATKEFSRQMEREKREESKIRHPERFLKKDFWKEFCLEEEPCSES